jgi:hypothetical protein
MPTLHTWDCIEAGNTYSEYKCEVCGETAVVAMEDSGPPMDGCIENTVGTPRVVGAVSDLTRLHDWVAEDKAAWDKRTGEVHKAPYPSDSPCYYCPFNMGDERVPGVNACTYCIQNPDALIYKDC